MIAAIVLAAGASRRFGAQKLLTPVGGKPVVRWAVERVRAARVDDIVVVLGREGDAVRAALDGLDVRPVENPAWAEGLSTSLRAGIQALRPGTESAIIVLGDQPAIEPGVVDRVIDAWRARRSPVVLPDYRDGRGHPVLFAAAVFPELLAVRGDRGARTVIDAQPARVEHVPVDHPAPPDLDAPDDIEGVTRSLL